MSRYIKVTGMSDHFNSMYYNLTASDIDGLIEDAMSFGEVGGKHDDIKVEMVEMSEAELANLEDAQ